MMTMTGIDGASMPWEEKSTGNAPRSVSAILQSHLLIASSSFL
jgi:hypothetical protein